jgi:hypothetical protein
LDFSRQLERELAEANAATTVESIDILNDNIKLRRELADWKQKHPDSYRRIKEQRDDYKAQLDDQRNYESIRNGDLVQERDNLRAELEGTIATMNISTKFEEIVNAFPQWLGDRKELVNLRAELAAATLKAADRNEWQQVAMKLQTELAALRAEVDRRREIMAVWVDHLEGCPIRYDGSGDCNCGLSEALTKEEPK